MHVDYTDAQRELRAEARDVFRRLMTPELAEELRHNDGGGPAYREAMRALGREGWLGLGWPAEHGGGGRSAMDEYIFFDEAHRAAFPIPLLTLNTVGPTLVHFGTDAQRARFVPDILRGECHFSIGYTEPSAGTDLASLSTRAVRDGDTYLINGQKIWHSLGSFADFIWLAVRTDPSARRHRGISVIIVPMDAPGVSRTPMRALGDNDVCAVYFEDVRVPCENLVGEENGGWRLITSQLNHERVALVSVGLTARLAEETRAWAARTSAGPGRRVLDLPWVQDRLAEVEARVEVLRLLNLKQAWNLTQGHLAPADASAIKVYGSELYITVCRALMEVLGAGAVLVDGSPGAALGGRIERFYRATLVLTFGGGTNEIQRDIIATAGLRLPRSRR